MHKNIFAFFRIVGIFAAVGIFVSKCFFRSIIKGHDLDWALSQRKKLAHFLIRRLRINLTITGRSPQGPVIFVANHRSYLDPVVFHQNHIFLPVAKADVARWPLIGYGVKITGVLYVKRADKESRRQTREAIADTLRAGKSVFICPEGTTHTKPQTIPFRKGTFVVAAEQGFPIVPVAIEYQDPLDAWVGNDSFIPHLFRLCKKPVIEVSVGLGRAIYSNDPDRLLQETQKWIDNRLKEIRADWKLPLLDSEPLPQTSTGHTPVQSEISIT